MPVNRPPRRCEGGFTLIELVIAAVLLLVAVGMGLHVVIGSLGNQQRARSTVAAASTITEAIDLFQRDVHNAAADDRLHGDIDRDDLQGAFLRNEPLAGAVDDVLVAQGKDLQVLSGGQCVRYVVETRTDGRWTLQRVAPCSSTQSTDRTSLLPWMPNGTSGLQPTFRYSLLVPTGGGSARCRHASAPQATGDDRRRITAITIDLTSAAIHSSGSGRAHLRRDVTLSNRLTGDYLYAIGCAT